MRRLYSNTTTTTIATHAGSAVAGRAEGVSKASSSRLTSPAVMRGEFDRMPTRTSLGAVVVVTGASEVEGDAVIGAAGGVIGGSGWVVSGTGAVVDGGVRRVVVVFGAAVVDGDVLGGGADVVGGGALASPDDAGSAHAVPCPIRVNLGSSSVAGTGLRTPANCTVA